MKSTSFNPISANITKWSNTLKQFVGKLPKTCLSVFDHFVGLALKGFSLTLFRMGFFGAAHGWDPKSSPPLFKICHTDPTTMKLGTFIPYLRKTQKIYKSRDASLEFCWYQHFSPEISKFYYIKKYRYRLDFDI